MNGGDDYIMSW